MSLLEWMEGFSYLVTVVGLPMAILVFLYDKRRERQNEEEETYRELSDEYTNFLKLTLDHPDLHLLRKTDSERTLTEEQSERQYALFNILVSLFERAYILVYEERMSTQTRRLWMSWEDYMREWCRRRDFCKALPELLRGEDDDFCKHIERIAREENAGSKPHSPESASAERR